jgi:hypothetical protein
MQDPFQLPQDASAVCNTLNTLRDCVRLLVRRPPGHPHMCCAVLHVLVRGAVMQHAHEQFM